MAKPRFLLLWVWIGFGCVFLLLQHWKGDFANSLQRTSADTLSMRLPENLENVALERFDKLVKAGQIFYEPSQPEPLSHHGFQFEFRIAPYLDRKPILSPESPERQKSGGPLENPSEDEIIASVGHAHRLLLNKYSIYRPMFVLATKRYAPQTDDLNLDDFEATWSVLQALKQPQLVIYNCGAGAGSSLGHKHLQIMPLPQPDSIELFPAHTTSATEVAENLPNVLFKHFVLKVNPGATTTDVFRQYSKLLEMSNNALIRANAGRDYNVMLTIEWIAVVPRRTAVWGGPWGANAAGMLGLITVPNKEQRQQWADLGFTDYLVQLGLPLD